MDQSWIFSQKGFTETPLTTPWVKYFSSVYTIQSLFWLLESDKHRKIWFWFSYKILQKMSLSTVSGSSLLLSALTVSTCIKICSNGTLVETTEYMTVDNFGNNYIFSLHHFRGLENFTASYMNWSLFFPVVCLRHITASDWATTLLNCLRRVL